MYNVMTMYRKCSLKDRVQLLSAGDNSGISDVSKHFFEERQFRHCLKEANWAGLATFDTSMYCSIHLGSADL